MHSPIEQRHSVKKMFSKVTNVEGNAVYGQMENVSFLHRIKIYICKS